MVEDKCRYITSECGVVTVINSLIYNALTLLKKFYVKVFYLAIICHIQTPYGKCRK
jgi:hypothetical protein